MDKLSYLLGYKVIENRKNMILNLFYALIFVFIILLIMMLITFIYNKETIIIKSVSAEYTENEI